MTDSALPPEYFARQDEQDDAYFYQTPRKVVHIDDGAIAALRDQFRALLPPGGAYLDLMSSWRSHLPPQLKPSRVVGLGMNKNEMDDNPQLTESVVQNLNRNPILPFPDNAFDAAFCTVSVQYLTRPIEVFAQVNRVLRPGGIFIVSFSNRCFPTKAVAVWRSSTDMQHIALVTLYFEQSGGWAEIIAARKDSGGSFLDRTDPLYLVWARKDAKGAAQ